MTKDRSAGWELSGYGGNDEWKTYRKALLKNLVLPCQKPDYPGPENDGCTECVVLIRGNQIIVGNAGDSRCVLSRNDVAVELSTDFKPDMEDERARILNSGHQVVFTQRGNVHGTDDGIAISRSLGDLCYKDRDDHGPEKQAIIAFPEVRTEEITQDDQLLIIPCYGNWDCLTQGVDFIKIYPNAHAIVLDLDAATGTSFFGVYDGHGGPAASKYCTKHLHLELPRHESFHDNLQTAIERMFLRVDEMMKTGVQGGNYLKLAYPGPENDGCTACAVLIRGNEIIVGNAGDSRCVLSRNDVAVELSTDFKPDMEDERARILNSGHQVVFTQRGNVHGTDDGIAISRSLGDLCYKDRDDHGPEKQAIIAFPEVRTEEITQDDQLLIIPCYGNWDCLTDQQAVDSTKIYSNSVVYGMLKHRALIVKFFNKIRNTVTLVLDGTNYDVLEQYIMVMAHIRFWFVSNGASINLRRILGYEKFVHIVPVEGTLHLVLRYGARSVNLIMDSREAWLFGEAGANSIVQFERKGCTPYIQHEYCISLNGDGRYSDITENGVGDIPIGIDALRTLCSLLSEADENDLDQIKEQLGVAVAHIMEPLKFYKAFEVVCGAILSGEKTTFKEKDPTLQVLVKIWGKSAKELGKHVFGHLCNRTQSFHLNTSLSNEKLNNGGIKTLEDIVENIFILPHAFIPKEYIEQKKKKKKGSDISSLVHSTWKPVDLGNGDPNVIPLQNLYRRIQDQREQNMRDKQFIHDRMKYFGDRLGGKPCSQALAFVKSGATTSVFSCKASMPLPVRGKHILNVVQIAKKFHRFLR